VERMRDSAEHMRKAFASPARFSPHLVQGPFRRRRYSPVSPSPSPAASLNLPRIPMARMPRPVSAAWRYTPAMADIGTLYEIGATGHRNFHRAYAWVRTALAFGVPEEDHDATVLKLGMIAARLGRDNIGGAERLAGAIATRIVYTCECSPGQETELASNGSL
jgi:hypothetical protein